MAHWNLALNTVLQVREREGHRETERYYILPGHLWLIRWSIGTLEEVKAVRD
jgi:hypothetical protein